MLTKRHPRKGARSDDDYSPNYENRNMPKESDKAHQ